MASSQPKQAPTILPQANLQEDPVPTDEQDTLDAWLKQSVLTLDGGGIRGYWSLLALEKLMLAIARREESYDKDVQADSHHKSSFAPERIPAYHTHVMTDEEKNRRERADGDERDRAIRAEIRYLPCHYFDIIGGSSTGGLIAIMLGRLRMTVLDCKEEYKTFGEKVFGKPRWTIMGLAARPRYDAEILEKVFRDVCKRRGEQSDTHTDLPFQSKSGLCKSFVTSLKTERNRQNITMYLIRSYGCVAKIDPTEHRGIVRQPSMHHGHWPEGHSPEPNQTPPHPKLAPINLGNAHKFPIWQVARAATAAHFYFAPIEIVNENAKDDSERRLIFEDGGLKTNNPTMYGVEEVVRRHGRGKTSVVVSVGTALERASGEASRWNISQGVRQDYNMLTDPEAVHYQVESLAEHREEGFAYLRINPLQTEHLLKMNLDEWQPRKTKKGIESGSTTLRTIEDTFNRWWSSDVEISRSFDRLAKRLVGIRRRRTRDKNKWERYAIGAEYACNVADRQICERPDRKWTSKADFIEHLERVHKLYGDALATATRNALDSTFQYREVK